MRVRDSALGWVLFGVFVLALVVGVLAVGSLGVALAFGVLLYGPYWYFSINSELRKLGEAVGDPGLSRVRPHIAVLAYVAGAVVVIPALVSLYRTGKRIERAQQCVGIHKPLDPVAVPILNIVLWPAMFWYAQGNLNAIWHRFVPHGVDRRLDAIRDLAARGLLDQAAKS